MLTETNATDVSGADKNNNDRTALLLGGGGARAAYQVGVLKAIAELLPQNGNNPFPIICGTSAGSINTVALASNARNFHSGVDKIIDVWSNFKLAHVFHADTKNLLKRIAGWAWANVGLGNRNKGPASILDNNPLRGLLDEHISFPKINAAIDSGHLHAYCLTACSYTSGVSTTFFDGAPSIQNWHRTHRKGQREKMNIDHLMASSAIPVIFPSVRIGNEHFGDGSMRQIAPISPALHLGARKILIIGLRIVDDVEPISPPQTRPSLGQISGYVLDTLFLNSLYSDVERMERLNRMLKNQQTTSQDQHDRLNIIEHMIISPSQDIADIALQHYQGLPRGFKMALKFLGMNQGNSRRFISYLMFTSNFCKELIDLGYADAMRERDALLEFLEA